MKLNRGHFIILMRHLMPEGTFSFNALTRIFKFIEQECPNAEFNPFDITMSFSEIKIEGEKQRLELENSDVEWLDAGDVYVLVDRTCGIFNQIKEN